MQLKKPKRIRGALAMATCTLLANSPRSDAATDNGEQWQVDSALLTYAEKDRVFIVEPVMYAKRAVGEDQYLSVRAVVDAMTGASPNGATPTASAQTFTGASGSSSYTTPANTTPKRDFSDARVALSVDWEKPLNRTLRSIIGANISKESDYFSTGASYTLSKDVNDKLTTFSAGLAGSYDLVMPKGGAPQALALLSTVAATPVVTGDEEGEDDGFSGESKILLDTMVGVTQVLTRRTLTQLNYSYGRSSGYLTDPYKVLSVVNGTTGQTLDYRYESRPDARNRQAVYWQTVQQLGEDVINLSYRYYWDDWGVRSHTGDLKYRFEFGPKHYLQPHIRYYEQTAADFYRHSLVAADPIPLAASADFRLGEMRACTVGLKYAHSSGKNGEWSLRAEYMKQTGNSHPADAIGVQKTQNLYPDLDVIIVQLGYSFVY